MNRKFKKTFMEKPTGFDDLLEETKKQYEEKKVEWKYVLGKEQRALVTELAELDDVFLNKHLRKLEKNLQEIDLDLF